MEFYLHVSIFPNVLPIFMYDFARQENIVKALCPTYNNLKMTYLLRSVSKTKPLDLFNENDRTIRSLKGEKIPNIT